MPISRITGSKDIQIDPKDLKRMSELVNTDFKYHGVPTVSHILRIEGGESTLSTYKKQVCQPVDR